jgi:hypothetical protein
MFNDFEKKSILRSTTVQGAVVTLLASLAGIFGLSYDAGTIAEIVNAAVVIGGFIWTVYGRIKAVSKVTITGK